MDAATCMRTVDDRAYIAFVVCGMCFRDLRALAFSPSVIQLGHERMGPFEPALPRRLRRLGRPIIMRVSRLGNP